MALDYPTENPEEMSEVERLTAVFQHITNTAIGHLENDLEVAQATGESEKIRLYQIQMSMYRHTQSILHMAAQYATDERWGEGE